MSSSVLGHSGPSAQVSIFASHGLASGSLQVGQFNASKIFVHPEKLSRWLSGSAFPPVTLELDLTLECNDRCVRCAHGFARGRRRLPARRVEELLAEARELGIDGLTITGGGEPLMHPEIGRILSAVRASGIPAGLFTNGGLIDERGLAQELVRSFSWIRASLDCCSEERFRRVRGRRGLSARLRSLQSLVAARNAQPVECELGVSFLTSSEVVPDIFVAAKTVRDLGFDYIQFKPMISWNEAGGRHRSRAMTQAGVHEAIGRAIGLESERFRVEVSWDRYWCEMQGVWPSFSAFHSAWFIAAVGPGLSANGERPALYLDCSAKYLPRWTICEFDSLGEALRSGVRKSMVGAVSSDVFCIPSEKHSVYNRKLEEVLRRHRVKALSREEVSAMAPVRARHPEFL